MNPTRRGFLKLFGLGAAAATLSAAGLYVPEPEPELVRRYWQVGEQLRTGAGLKTAATWKLHEPDGTIITAQDFFDGETDSSVWDSGETPSIVPVRSCPGLFRDKRTGLILNIRDF
jgi:hypothetical protein